MTNRSEHNLTEILDRMARRTHEANVEQGLVKVPWDELDGYQKQQFKQQLLPSMMFVLDIADEVAQEEGARPTKIPVVTTGEYDDFRTLVAVDGTLEDAKLLASRLNGTDSFAKASEDELLVVKADVPRVEVLKASVTIWDDDRIEKGIYHTTVEWPWSRYSGDEYVAASWRWVRAPMHKDKGGRLDVEGTDHALVRKFLAEETRRILADPALRERRDAEGEVS